MRYWVSWPSHDAIPAQCAIVLHPKNIEELAETVNMSVAWDPLVLSGNRAASHAGFVQPSHLCTHPETGESVAEGIAPKGSSPLGPVSGRRRASVVPHRVDDRVRQILCLAGRQPGKRDAPVLCHVDVMLPGHVGHLLTGNGSELRPPGIPPRDTVQATGKLVHRNNEVTQGCLVESVQS